MQFQIVCRNLEVRIADRDEVIEWDVSLEDGINIRADRHKPIVANCHDLEGVLIELGTVIKHQILEEMKRYQEEVSTQLLQCQNIVALCDVSLKEVGADSSKRRASPFGA